MRKPRGYWDVFEHCFEEAKKYRTLAEFNKNNPCAKSCRKHGWMDSFPWLKDARYKEIIQYSLEGEVVGRYSSSLEAADVLGNGSGYTASEIRNCCRGVVRTAYGFIWLYSEFENRAEELIAERLAPIEYKPSKYNKEYCMELAMRCSTLKEFYTEYSNAHHISKENGWIEEYTWLKRADRSEIDWGKWSEKEVDQYTLNGEYIRTWESGTKAAIWLGDIKKVSKISSCCHLTRVKAYGYRWLFSKDRDRADEIFATVKNVLNRKPDGYSEEEVREEAGKYETLKDFSEGSYYYYRAARRMGIVNDLNFKCRIPNPYLDRTYCVYAYEFKETLRVYIGITCHKKQRMYAHLSGKKKSTVYKYSVESNIKIPEPKYLNDGLYPLDACELEDKWRKIYAEKGWVVINKAKTGRYSSALGACKKISNGKLLELASKFEYLAEFRAYYGSRYALACQRGLDLSFLKRGCPRKFSIVMSNPFFAGEEWELTAFRSIKDAADFAGLKSARDFQKLIVSGRNVGLYFYSLAE